jgi:hypothetical protein
MSRKLNHQEARIIEHLQKNKTITSTESEFVCGGTYKQSANLLLRLEKEKILKKLSRGVYTLGVTTTGAQKEIKFRTQKPIVKEQEAFMFLKEDNWEPKKAFVIEPIMECFIEAVKNLNKSQSVQILVTDIKKHCNWGEKTSNYIGHVRFRCKKRLAQNYIAKLKFFVEKDELGAVFAIRVMNYYGQ